MLQLAGGNRPMVRTQLGGRNAASVEHVGAQTDGWEGFIDDSY